MKALMIAALALLVSSSASAATITVNGTSGSDVIVFGILQTRSSTTSPWVTVGERKYRNFVLSTTGAVSGDNINVYGGDGDDDLLVVNATSGVYTISPLSQLIPFTVGVRFHLYGDDGEDQLRGGDSKDVLVGGAGSDVLSGAGGDDDLIGYIIDFAEPMGWYCSLLVDDGADKCSGNDGDDTIVCEPLLNGGAGSDYCADGTGNLPAGCEDIACYY